MSDRNKADDKGFLSRWSQRKHEAKQPDRDAPVADAQVPSAPAESEPPEPEFDLSSLPKLEDLTETTDITVFLRKGVPEHLRNAALRKSWALDPAIRNYVNPALDYAYDWNTPGGVPGNGEIGAGVDIARMVSQIMGGSESAVEPETPIVESGNETTAVAELLSGNDAAQKPELELPGQPLRLSRETVSGAQKAPNGEDGGHNEDYDGGVAPQQAVRRHGSAKPVV